MKLAIVSNGNAFSTLMLRSVIENASVDVVAAVVVEVPPGAGGRLGRLIRLARRTGWRYGGFKALTSFVVPWLAGIGAQEPVTLAPLLRSRGVRILEPPSANDDAAVAFIAGVDPDVLLSVSSPERFDEPLLRTAGHAAINVHWAPLPAYGGVAPYFWSLRNGEPTTGVTVHEMIAKLDAGRILAQQQMTISGADSALSLQLRLAAAGGEALSAVLASLDAGLQAAKEQNLSKRSYYSWPTPADVRALRRRGRRLARVRDLLEMRRVLRAAASNRRG